MATDPWGVDDGYFDVEGNWIDTPEERRGVLRATMGADPDRPDDGPPQPDRPVWFVRAGLGKGGLA